MDTEFRVHFLMSRFFQTVPRIIRRFRISRQNAAVYIVVSGTLLFGCSPGETPTPFRPPTQPGPTQVLPTTTPVPVLFTPFLTATGTATLPGPCINDLSFLEDLTIPDNSLISPGSAIDKQWLVSNRGTCDWDGTYNLKWVGGDTLGAAEVQPLFPARAGAQAALRVLFVAPSVEGPYESAWQAVDPDGNFFGDLIFIKILVSL
ncbi:MAG: hypothetical protein FJZ87_03650 [Chloroflexi bacterium]|nr:hypothetical protein [Chloroflexota bacterium]